MIDFVLVGTVVPLTPINISRPDTDPKDEWAGIPKITLPGRREVPNIPGETWKGMMRAASCDLATRDRKLSLTLYNTLFKGGIKGSEKESVDDLRKTQSFRNSNPVLGLYGASSPRWVQGCMSFGPAFPQSEEEWAITRSNGVRRDDFRITPERLNNLEEEAVENYLLYAALAKEYSQRDTQNDKLGLEIYKLNKPRDGVRRPDAAEIIAAHKETIAANTARMAVIKESEHYKNTIGRPLPNKNGISPESVLHQRISATAATDVEFGLFLETLRHLRHDCRIGGLKSIGYGLFTASWRLSVKDAMADDFVDAGSIRLEPNGFALETVNETVLGAIAAWKANGDGVETLDAYLKKDAA